jgi:hypothetical protein
VDFLDPTPFWNSKERKRMWMMQHHIDEIESSSPNQTHIALHISFRTCNNKSTAAHATMRLLSSNCTLLAATLSAAYRSYHEYHPGEHESLESFLDENGVLVTMCMRYHGHAPWLECSRSKKDHRVEASWIQQEKTGFRVVVPPVNLGVPVGLVLQPSATNINCLYPLDAATDQRDDDGCGPVTRDPKYGSKGYDHQSWYGKALARAQIVEYKRYAFPNRTWNSIPCGEFLQSGDPNSPNANLTKNIVLADLEEDDNHQEGEWYFQTETEYTVEDYSYIMGHDVCNRSSPFPKPIFNESSFLLYKGPNSWSPCGHG